MIKIELIPETACLMLKIDDELISSKFYNKYSFNNGDISSDQIRLDSNKMIKKYLRAHINNMLEYFGWHDHFNSKDIEILMQLADYTEHNIRSLINTFYDINTKIADNGGAPILKEILKLI